MPDRQRLYSGLIALSYVSAMWRHEGWTGALAVLLPLALPLGMIWYAGSISRMHTWWWVRTRIDRPSPPAAIRWLGWILLLIPAVVMIALKLRTI